MITNEQNNRNTNGGRANMDNNTAVKFNYNSLSAAAHNHEDGDEILVAVTVEIPTVLTGAPREAGPFLAEPVAEYDFCEPTTGCWIATGRTAFHKVGGAPGAPIAHYIDINSIAGLVGRDDILENTEPGALAGLAATWALGIGEDARQIWIDQEGTIRERINF